MKFTVLNSGSARYYSHKYLFNTIWCGKGTLYGPVGLQEAEASGIFRQSARERDKVVCPTHRPPLPTGDILRLSRPPGPRMKSMKFPNGCIGDGTRYLPSCSAVPQPTTPLRIPIQLMHGMWNLLKYENLVKISSLWNENGKLNLPNRS
jgi:hypothetical protein